MKALVLDDDETVRWLLTCLARDAGLEVAEAGTLAQADAFEPGCDVLVIDCNLPDGSGLDWLRSRRALGDVRPAMIVSGMVPPDGWRLEFGLARWLVKPFDTAEYQAALLAMMESARHLASIASDTARLRALVSGTSTGEAEAAKRRAWANMGTA